MVGLAEVRGKVMVLWWLLSMVGISVMVFVVGMLLVLSITELLATVSSVATFMVGTLDIASASCSTVDVGASCRRALIFMITECLRLSQSPSVFTG